ncbi:hypothetical protein [Halobacillus litoralis]|uniref:hypothetical protein n=1 Tax=Halobacillus litoralis TaxID=45668 RepID=UPI00137209ED|nr:hypothetical protein [Halobacillus litoralis]MYL39401.1 hypothetical protein [Halobacillus litoralis]
MTLLLWMAAGMFVSGALIERKIRGISVLWIAVPAFGGACAAGVAAGIPGPLLVSFYGMVFLAGAGMTVGIQSAVEWTKRESG